MPLVKELERREMIKQEKTYEIAIYSNHLSTFPFISLKDMYHIYISLNK